MNFKNGEEQVEIIKMYNMMLGQKGYAYKRHVTSMIDELGVIGGLARTIFGSFFFI